MWVQSGKAAYTVTTPTPATLPDSLMGAGTWWCRLHGPPPRTELSRASSVADAISSSNPRVIDDARARKLSNDLKRCTYYETCATYGLNVERVFQDGKWRVGGLRPRGGASAGSSP